MLIATIAATGPSALWPVLTVPVLTGLPLGRIRVTADRRGLRLVTGLIGVPVKHIPLADIASADVTQVDPLEWGVWGFRVTPGRSGPLRAAPGRSGPLRAAPQSSCEAAPGLLLHLRDGRRFAVTMDDPRTRSAHVRPGRGIMLA